MPVELLSSATALFVYDTDKQKVSIRQTIKQGETNKETTYATISIDSSDLMHAANNLFRMALGRMRGKEVLVNVDEEEGTLLSRLHEILSQAIEIKLEVDDARFVVDTTERHRPWVAIDRIGMRADEANRDSLNALDRISDPDDWRRE